MLNELLQSVTVEGKASPAGCKLSFTLPITAYPSVPNLIRCLHILRPPETNKLESCVFGHGSKGNTLAEKEWIHLMVGNKNVGSSQSKNRELGWGQKEDLHMLNWKCVGQVKSHEQSDHWREGSGSQKPAECCSPEGSEGLWVPKARRLCLGTLCFCNPFCFAQKPCRQ